MTHPKQNNSIELDTDDVFHTPKPAAVDRVTSLSSTPRGSVSSANAWVPNAREGTDITDGTGVGRPTSRSISHTRGEKFDPSTENYRIGCLKLNGKTAILLIQFLIVFGIIGTYFGYNIFRYFDTSTNRKDYTKDETVDTMPIPFVYIDFERVDGCQVTLYFANDDTSIYLYSGNYTNYDINIYNTSHRNTIDIETILDEESSDEWKVIYVENSYWMQYLFIPPVSVTMAVDSKETAKVQIYCDWYGDYLWNDTTKNIYYYINHRDQLYDYGTLDNVMTTFYYTSDYIFSGYDISLSDKIIFFFFF